MPAYSITVNLPYLLFNSFFIFSHPQEEVFPFLKQKVNTSNSLPQSHLQCQAVFPFL
jgi:hypothetical protein